MVTQWIIVLGGLVQQVPKSICQLLAVAYSGLVNVTVAMYLLRGYPILTQEWQDFSLRNLEAACPFCVWLLVHSQLQEDGCHLC